MEEKEFKGQLDNSLRKHQKFLSGQSPEEKIQYEHDVEESKEKLQHCFEDGIYKANKIQIDDFLYIKDLKLEEHVNKILIRQLAFLSSQNIILRYLLIEAALNNDVINDVLNKQKLSDDKKFYSLPNNPDKFYNRSHYPIPEEERLSNLALNYELYRYGISTPEEASKIKIKGKIEKIFGEKVKFYFNKLSVALNEEITHLIKNNPEFNFHEYIETPLNYFFDNFIEYQFLLKNHHSTEGFILYLNEMYWLNEENLNLIINSYMSLPNLLLNVANEEKLLFNSAIPVLNREIKIRKISNNKPNHELFVYAYFKYYKKNKGLSAPNYNQPNKKKKYNQIHALIDANKELETYKHFDGYNEYDFFSDKWQEFKDWISDTRKKYCNFESLIDF